MKVLIGLSIFLTAVLIAAICVRVANPSWLAETPFARSENGGAAGDSVPPATAAAIEKIARAWADDSINGAAGDDVVNFIVEESNAMQPEMLRDYLKPRLESATAWSYGAIARADGDDYEVTATATTMVHDMMPPPVFTFGDEKADSDLMELEYRRIATTPFRLTVDADSKSVADWRASADGAGVVETFNGKAMVNHRISIEDLHGAAAAICIGAATAASLDDYDMRTLFLPPEHRKDADAAQARAAVDSAGLGGVCEDWIGE